MRVRSQRRPPQGTVDTTGPAQARRVASVVKRLEEEEAIETLDNDVASLIEALDRKDDAESARLIRILKARHGDKWPAMARTISRRVK